MLARTTTLLLVSFASLAFAGALAADVPVRDHDITIEDYFSLAWVRELAVSPDGSRVAYTEDRWEAEDEKQNRDLWVLDLATRTRQRLTFDKARDHEPMWSADGAWIYFASEVEQPGETDSSDDKEKQVWRVSPSGGQLQPVTRVEDGIELFDLADDGRALYYTVGVEKVDPEWRELREKYDQLEYGHGVTEFSELWMLDLESWRATKLVDERRVIKAFEVSADRRRIAMLTNPDEELIHNEGWSRVDVYDADSESVSTVTGDGWRADHPSPFGWLDQLSWSSDSRALAFSVSFDGYPTRVYVAEWSQDGPQMRELERPDGVSVWGKYLRWRPGSRDLCFIGDEQARSRLLTFKGVRDGGQGRTVTLTPGDVTVEAYDFSSSADTLVLITSTPTDPPDLYRLEDEGKLDRLTRVNPQVDTWKLPQISLVDWTGDGGRGVQGVLELPPDYEQGDGPLPMVVHLHGGPTSATRYRFRFRQHGRTALAAKGYALLSPNYRGSTGYGDDFMIELIGRENDVDVKDILAGVDAMVERGIADPQRLGVMGWSNGGFLTNCLIAGGDRFKAAVSGAGVIDQVLQWGIEDTPGHVINFMSGRLPWEGAEIYREGSPLYGLRDARTPTLIHVGADDERVPAAHARVLHRALQFYSKVPAELIVYPDEPHGLTRYDHQKAKMEWDHAWFGRYLASDRAE
jgi:dipeptidyl aminopeptidase/acylaminoacyl peptidase